MEERHESHEGRPQRWALPALIGTGLVSALLYLFAWRPMAYRFALDTPPDQHPIVGFLALWFIAFALYFVGIRFASRVKRRAAALAVIAVFGAAFRLTMWQTPPILEDDIYRYLWDGYVTAHGQNPFRFAPVEVAQFAAWDGVDIPSARLPRDQVCRMPREEIGRLLGADGLTEEDRARLARLQELTRRERFALNNLTTLWDTERYGEALLAINHPHIPTIYPPFAQVVFAAASWVKPMDMMAVKGLVILFDILTGVLIAVLLRMLGRNPCLCVIYAWSPLVIKEFANTGHCDAIAVCCVVGALVLVLRGRRVMTGAALALGFLTKMFPMVLIPIAWRRMGRRGVIAFAILVVLFYLPFAGLGIGEMFQGLGAYAERWEFNSGLFTLFEKNVAERLLPPPHGAIDPFLATKLATGAVFLALLAWLVRREDDGDIALARRMFIVLGALLLLGPTANAWYFCWIAPFLCVFPRRSWLLLTCLVGLVYLYHVPPSAAADGWVWNTLIRPVVVHIPFGPRGDAALWQALPDPARNEQLHEWWRTFGVRLAEYVPFYALLIGEAVAVRRRRNDE
ncbi:MAG: glycosyltransferase family 87 protein [Planctomycetota bacterium]